MTGVDFFRTFEVGEFLVVCRLHLFVGYGTVDFLGKVSIPQGTQFQEVELALEVRILVQAIFTSGMRHQFHVDHDVQKKLAPLCRREPLQFLAQVLRSKGEIGFGDFRVANFRDHIVRFCSGQNGGSERQRQERNGKRLSRPAHRNSEHE